MRKQLEYNNRVANLSTKVGASTASAAFKAIIAELHKPVTGSSQPSMGIQKYIDEYHKGVLGSIEDKNLDSDNVGDQIQAKVDAGDLDEIRQKSFRYQSMIPMLFHLLHL